MHSGCLLIAMVLFAEPVTKTPILKSVYLKKKSQQQQQSEDLTGCVQIL